MDYHGKVALITGGSSGIGLAAARKLAGQGANVWILGRNQARLDEALAQVVAEKISNDQSFGCLPADVTRPGEVDLAVQRLVQAAGIPDLVVNSAGRATPGYFEDLSLDVFRDMMDINYFGIVNVTKAVVPGMVQRGSGTIVNISSMAGYFGPYGFTAYAASKHAVRGLTETLRAELKPKGIQVSIVFPPTTETPGLVQENQVKPADVMAFEGNVKAMSPEAVADIILRGVARGRYMILPGFDNVIYYQLIRFAGNLAYPVIDWMVASAQKKTGRRPQR